MSRKFQQSIEQSADALNAVEVPNSGGVKSAVSGGENRATSGNEYCQTGGAPAPVFGKKFRVYTGAKWGLWEHLITSTLMYMGSVCCPILMFAEGELTLCTAQITRVVSIAV